MIGGKKTFIVIPAYNSGKTLRRVIGRIPQDIFSSLDGIIIVDDGSLDNTRDEISELSSQDKRICAVIHEKNLGYASAQKSGFSLALKNGADIVILLHADGQYAPEELPGLLGPLLRDETDIVQGSRILGGKCIEGGMPLYRYLAIRIASFFENVIYGMRLKEYHSGFMLYSRKALETIPYRRLSDTMYFDGEMLFVGHAKRLRIMSLPIPTAYFKDQKSGVRPVQYAFQVVRIMLKKLCGGYDRL